jgi:ribonuclease BN (tRNA processing enzyme)
LRCFGYLFELDGLTVGYSGDTRTCPGLDELAGAADVLVLECNGAHPAPVTHMEEDAVRALRARHPGVTFILTHMGPGVDGAGMDDVVVPDDFDRIDLEQFRR